MFDLAMILVILQVLPTELIAVLTPVVVFGAVQLLKLVLPKIPGWALLAIVVPVLSAVVAWISQIIVGGVIGFWAQVGLGLLAVFVNELLKQIRQGND